MSFGTRRLLNLSLATCVAFVIGVASAQAPASQPEFEVASVKPAEKMTMAMITSGQLHSRRDNAAFEESNIPLSALIAIAYQINSDRRMSGPNWMQDQYFSVAAKLPAGSTKEQIPAMLQKLLSDRFKLVVHHDQKVESVYLLVVDKKGAMLKRSAGDADENAKGCSARPGQFSCRDVTLATLAEYFSGMATMSARMPAAATVSGDAPRNIDLPVVDETDLTGKYDIDLQWIPPAGLGEGRRGGAAFPPRDPTVKATSIFDAIEAVGLKLRPGKHTYDVLVVDHVERVPIEN